MKEKWMNSVMAGVFISMGAMTYLAIPNTLVGSLFFAVGILLVLNLHNMLVTRVCPLLVYDGRYSWGEVAIAWAGNGIGTLAVAAAVQGTRFKETIREPLARISETKLQDGPLSLLFWLCSAASLWPLPFSSAPGMKMALLPRTSMCGFLSPPLYSAGLSI